MKKITLFIILFFLVTLNVQAVEITLEQDTNLHPQGWVSGTLKFKKGTAVLNERGEVVSGIMKDYERLRPAGWSTLIGIDGNYIDGASSIHYAPGLVVFNERGEIISGILATTAGISLYNGNFPYVYFKNELIFNPDRSVSKGSLSYDTYLRPLGWSKQTWPIVIQSGFIKFKNDKQVVLSKGEVVSGTLAQDTELMTTNGKRKLFEAGTLVTFNANGEAL